MICWPGKVLVSCKWLMHSQLPATLVKHNIGNTTKPDPSLFSHLIIVNFAGSWVGVFNWISRVGKRRLEWMTTIQCMIFYFNISHFRDLYLTFIIGLIGQGGNHRYLKKIQRPFPNFLPFCVLMIGWQLFNHNKFSSDSHIGTNIFS